ncbi:MAG TPA: hypothetical protein VGY98_05685 [Verrucomicrobiae bacterium]|nr:hypothetical protein [Verrucomicrobiae bacterium]
MNILWSALSYFGILHHRARPQPGTVCLRAQHFDPLTLQRFNVIALACATLFAFAARADDSTPIMPLSDVKAGMNGEWRTVVSGTRIDSFPMRVVGVADNFIGPGRPVIICEGLDATNKLTGPVAGMSGSPVYVDGKLLGAYAYGFIFPHDQDLFGVTPIEQMLEVEKYPPASNPWGSDQTADAAGSGSPQWLAAPAAGLNAPPLAAMQSVMKPLPTPLFVSGVSVHTLRMFQPQLDKLGLQMMQAPSGSAGAMTNTDLEPGAAVSGVLMSGDFDFAGTGTVTWRHGNRILAFGHPFMQSGPTEMPMATAEILTVVSSFEESFKLLNVGTIVGTIYQDRLTAIAGEVGRMPRTTQVQIDLTSPTGQGRVYRGDMFQNQLFSPVLTAISLEEALFETMESEEKQTIYLETDMEIEGHGTVKLMDAATEENGPFMLAMQQLELYDGLLGNPCEFPRVKSLVFHVRLANGFDWSRLNSLSMDRNEVRAGATLHAVIGLRNYRGEASVIPIAVPIPADVAASNLHLFVGDADAAMRLDETPTPPRTLDQVLDRMRKTRSHQNICVKLLQSAPGLSVGGENLPDLPPSVVAQFESPNASLRQETLDQVTLWETNFPVSGTFSGEITLPVSIK